MLNIKVTPLNLTVSTIVILAALKVAPMFETTPSVTVDGRNVVSLNDGVDAKSVKLLGEAIDAIAAKNPSRMLIKITSPGGSVLDGREILKRFDDTPGTSIDTYADNHFMSMGMSIFLEGDRRLVTKEALGLIHRGSVGGSTYFELKLKLEELQAELETSEEHALEVEIDPEAASKAKPARSVSSIKNNIANIENLIHIMDKLFEPEFRKLEEIKKTAPNPAKTQEIIDLMKEGKMDLTLNADELLESGIATAIVTPAVIKEYTN